MFQDVRHADDNGEGEKRLRAMMTPLTIAVARYPCRLYIGQPNRKRVGAVGSSFTAQSTYALRVLASLTVGFSHIPDLWLLSTAHIAVCPRTAYGPAPQRFGNTQQVAYYDAS